MTGQKINRLEARRALSLWLFVILFPSHDVTEVLAVKQEGSTEPQLL